jgi:hypothetical protein
VSIITSLAISREFDILSLLSFGAFLPNFLAFLGAISSGFYTSTGISSILRSSYSAGSFLPNFFTFFAGTISDYSET